MRKRGSHSSPILKYKNYYNYAQGYALALLGRKLFNEDIVCWAHGPVVKSIYYQYKAYGKSPLPPSFIEMTKYDEDELCILNHVRYEYGQYTAWKLRNMTHDEAPYLNTPSGDVMNEECIKDFFVNKISQNTFSFDLEMMKSRVEGKFVKMPSDVGKDSFFEWVKSI
ncbi:hypothetical protein AAEX37_00235 [Oligella sp. MSHR50489EDL]